MSLEIAVKNLERHGFAVRVFKTGDQAVKTISQELSGKTIGFGGSITLDALGLYESLRQNNDVSWHWRKTPGAREKSACAQVYFTSANAISETGEIVNIDGTGNRAASMLFGHEELYIIAGTNKLTPDLPSAMDRARNVASPLNARRLHCQTPCALSDPMRCHDCSSPDRICNGFVTLARPTDGTGKAHVILIEENLGY